QCGYCAHVHSRAPYDCISGSGRRDDCDRALPSAHQHHHNTATTDVIGFAGMTNECKMTNREGSPSIRTRHSGFVINSSFRAEGAVTVIELLLVIMVILILAALILATSS